MKKVEKILTHKRDLKARMKSIDEWKIDKKDKEDLFKFLEDYRGGEITGRIGTNIDVTIERIIQYLRPAFEFISKKNKIYALNKNSLEVVKKLKDDLLKDKVKNHFGKPYGLRTKKMILYTFGKYIQWKLKPEDYIILSKPLLIRLDGKEHEPESFNLEQLEKLYKACSTDAQRFLIIVLFSSGTRAEEFHNIRFSDITLPNTNDAFVKIRVRHGFSKTKGRTITLYHKRALEVVRDYVNLRKSEGCSPDEPILKMSYDTGRKWLTRLGKKVLNINLHYHLFRSSSATWLASRMNRQQLCIYFGWKFNSPMPDIYISRNGLEMKEVDKKFEATEIETLKDRLEKTEHESKLKNDEVEKLKNIISKMPEEMEKKLGEAIQKAILEEVNSQKKKGGETAWEIVN